MATLFLIPIYGFNPSGLFLMWYLKRNIFIIKPASIETRKEQIRRNCRLISPEVIRNVQNESITLRVLPVRKWIRFWESLEKYYKF